MELIYIFYLNFIFPDRVRLCSLSK